MKIWLRRPRRFSIRGVGLVCLLLLIAAPALLLLNTNRVVGDANATHRLLVTAANQVTLLQDVRAQYLEEWMALLSTRGAIDDRFIARYRAAHDRLDSDFGQLREIASGLGPEAQARVDSLSGQHQDLIDAWTPVITLLVQGRPAEAQAAIQAGLRFQSDAFLDSISGEIDVHRAELNAALSESRVSLGRWRQSALLVAGMAILLVVVGAYVSNRWLLRPLASLARSARLIAAGDLAAVAQVKGPAEFERLATDVNIMAASLMYRSEQLSDYLAKDLEARTAELEAANEALRTREAELTTVIENAPVVLFALDRDGTCTFAKGKAMALLGLDPDNVAGTSPFDITGQEGRAADALRTALGGREFTGEITVAGRTLDTHLSPVLDDAGALSAVIGVAVDVTERQRAQAALAQSEERYRDLVENANDVIFTHDLEGRLTSINRAGVLLTGYSEAEALQLSLSDLITPETLDSAIADLERKLGGEVERTTFEVDLIARDGRVVPMEVSSRLAFEDGKPVGVQGIARDISERRRAEAALRRHADEVEALFEQLSTAHAELAASQRELERKSAQLEEALESEKAAARLDPLTGALNHGGIVSVLRDVVAGRDGCESAAIFMVDIDNMKSANDLYGHQFGDRVLHLVAETLSLRGAVVGRYGGDEFVSILKGAGQETADAYSKEVLAAIAAAGLEDPAGGREVQVHVSIGCALWPSQARSAEDLLSLADAAMYAYKRTKPASRDDLNRTAAKRALRLATDVATLLAGPADPRENLPAVCEMLALDCGYAAVGIVVSPEVAGSRDLLVTYPRLPDDVAPDWVAARRWYFSPSHPLTARLIESRSAVVLERPEVEARLHPLHREGLARHGLQSLMVAPLIWRDDVVGAVLAGARDPGAFGSEEARALEVIASQVASIFGMSMLIHDYKKSAERLGGAQRATGKLLAAVVEVQSGVPGHDVERLYRVAERLAQEMGFAEDLAADVGLATVLHDVGKYRVPAAILARPHDLDHAEWEVVREHTTWGAELLSSVPALALAAQVARWHHERWDGLGYPDGLAGDDIPLPVAIASVVDALDAMLYDRIYRPSMSLNAALAEVRAGAGSHFNPRVVEVLLDLVESGEVHLVSSVPGSSAAA